MSVRPFTVVLTRHEPKDITTKFCVVYAESAEQIRDSVRDHVAVAVDIAAIYDADLRRVGVHVPGVARPGETPPVRPATRGDFIPGACSLEEFPRAVREEFDGEDVFPPPKP